MERTPFIRIFLAAFGILLYSAEAANRNPLTFDDLMKVHRVADPQISPDGKWIAYTVTAVDKEKNSSNSDIWIIPVAGGEARRLTRSPKIDYRPRWSPDSKEIAFVSARDGTSQIYRLPIGGGEARKATDIATEASGVLYSPDGKHLLFTSDVYPGCDSGNPQQSLECNASKKKQAEDSKVKAHIAERLLFRHWNGWKDDKRSHLFIMPVDGSQPPRDLTPGNYDVPPFSLGGPDDYAFSPDGKEICYAVKQVIHEERSTNLDLFAVDLQTNATIKITTNAAHDGSPLYSPDGRYIAYRAQFRAGYESDRFRLMIYERATKQRRNLTETFDRWADSFAWAPDSKKIFFIADDRGRSSIFEVLIEDRGMKRISGENCSGDPGITPDGNTLVFTRSSMHRPAEIFSIGVDGSGLAPLTHHNDSLLAALDMNQAEEFWLDGATSSKGPRADPAAAKGFLDPDQLQAPMPNQKNMEIPKVHSWILKPPSFDASRKYPALLLVHGGPQGAWMDNWGFRWNPQMYAAAGYVVVMPNPRGSTGYGQQFIDEINRDWGGRCFKDLMLALDAVEQLPYVDKTKIAAAGASFGGFMINWFQGHTDRFKALIAHAGGFDQTTAYYVTEELWFPEWEMGGTPYENQELYDFLSPGRYVMNFKTPQLVTHGELDFRVPIGEGLAMFTALQRRGIESKLLYYPDEGHWISKPQNAELFYKTVIDWLKKHIGP
ncbi:MAG: S9 family peptidase [Acidobacteria bacterium]|nr:S9 family peptidase [Acidobacteriota bacterium]